MPSLTIYGHLLGRLPSSAAMHTAAGPCPLVLGSARGRTIYYNFLGGVPPQPRTRGRAQSFEALTAGGPFITFFLDGGAAPTNARGPYPFVCGSARGRTIYYLLSGWGCRPCHPRARGRAPSFGALPAGGPFITFFWVGVPPPTPARGAAPLRSGLCPRADHLFLFFWVGVCRPHPRARCRAPSFGALPSGGPFITFSGSGGAASTPPTLAGPCPFLRGSARGPFITFFWAGSATPARGAVPLFSGLCPRADHLLNFFLSEGAAPPTPARGAEHLRSGLSRLRTIYYFFQSGGVPPPPRAGPTAEPRAGPCPFVLGSARGRTIYYFFLVGGVATATLSRGA
jgi:hypothetical protein